MNEDSFTANARKISTPHRTEFFNPIVQLPNEFDGEHVSAAKSWRHGKVKKILNRFKACSKN